MKNKNTRFRAAKNIFSTILLSFLVLAMSGCEKDEDTVSPSGGDDYGTVTFWNNQSYVGNIKVIVDNGTSDWIDITTEATECGETDCASFYLRQGSHTFTAESVTGESWSGTFTLSSNCLLFQLY